MIPRSPSPTPVRGIRIGLLFLAMACLPAEDLDTIRSRMFTFFRGSTPTAAATLDGWIAGQSATGSWWGAVDYARVDLWGGADNPNEHMTRLVQLARAYRIPSAPGYGSATYRTAIIAGIDAWVALDPRSSNWFNNILSVPYSMGQVMVLMDGELPAATASGALAVVARARAYAQAESGANLVWKARIGLVEGVVDRNPDAARWASDRLLAAVTTLATGYDDQEGHQVDGSFWQHGHFIYQGGYGGYLNEAMAMSGWIRGTAYAQDATLVPFVQAVVIDGYAPCIRGRWFDRSVMGRYISRAGNGVTSSLAGVCDQLIAQGASATAALAGIARRWRGQDGAPGHDAFAKSYWRSDYLVHSRPDWFWSVRAASDRTVASEDNVNGENTRGWFLGDGVFFYLRTGDEWQDLAPVAEWARLPGTTCRLRTVFPKHVYKARGARPFSGGTVLDGLSVYGYDQASDGVEARKTYIGFDDAIVLLGSGITSTAGEPVATTFTQSRLRGAVTVATDAGVGTTASGAIVRDDVRWVHHDGTGYIPAAPARIRLRSDTATGSWRGINDFQSSATVSDALFVLGQEHGVGPAGATYACLILPGAGATETAARFADPGIAVVRQDAGCHAAVHRGGGAAAVVFFAAGELDLGPALDLRLGCSIPATVLLRRIPDGYRISVADPLRSATAARLRLDRPVAGPGASWDGQAGWSAIDIPLPAEEPHRGRPVVVEILDNRPPTAGTPVADPPVIVLP